MAAAAAQQAAAAAAVQAGAVGLATQLVNDPAGLEHLMRAAARQLVMADDILQSTQVPLGGVCGPAAPLLRCAVPCAVLAHAGAAASVRKGV